MNDKNTSDAILKFLSFRRRRRRNLERHGVQEAVSLALEHGHPLANLPNRFGGQQKSEELNIMKGSAFIVGESRRVSDADRRT
jgi:hypothetical protein